MKSLLFYIIAGEKKNIFHHEIEFLQMTFEVIINRGLGSFREGNCSKKRQSLI